MQLSGYSDLVKLTRGGMSTLYKARQDSLDRTVAIKFLSAEFLWDAQALQFFDQESLVIARLNHPNIIHVIDRGVSEKGRPFFVMDYIHGRELSVVNQNDNLCINDKLKLLLQICKGLSFAHKNGVVHRDIKPANILVNDDMHVTILDFGIAWLEANGKPGGEEIVGTPDYMSPEQFSDPRSISQLSDIYSLGAVMFELFSGQLPAAHYNNLQQCLLNLPETLSSLIIQCLQSDPGSRPGSADSLAFMLLKILKGAHLKQSEKEDAGKALGESAGKFELLDVLNKSRFSTVYLFQDKSRKTLIVVKKRVGSRAGLKEAEQLKKIRHDNIVRVLGTSKNKRAFIVVMEYMPSGSLQDRLSRPYTVDRFIAVAVQLCAALQVAHEENIIHGNLRPSNILFDKDKHLKITDFGLQEHYLQQNEENWYLAGHHQMQTEKKDIFSAGAIFYHMLCGSPPVMKFAQLKNNSFFDSLDERIQTLLKNMLETQSINSFESFADVMTELQGMQVKMARTSVSTGKPVFSLSRFFFILIMMNLFLAIWYYFFK